MCVFKNLDEIWEREGAKKRELAHTHYQPLCHHLKKKKKRASSYRIWSDLGCSYARFCSDAQPSKHQEAGPGAQPHCCRIPHNLLARFTKRPVLFIRSESTWLRLSGLVFASDPRKPAEKARRRSSWWALNGESISLLYFFSKHAQVRCKFPNNDGRTGVGFTTCWYRQNIRSRQIFLIRDRSTVDRICLWVFKIRSGGAQLAHSWNI